MGQYLVRIAGNAFLNGKLDKPFLQASYSDPLVFALAHANLIWLRTDENGLIEDYPDAKFRTIMNNLFHFLFSADYSTLELPPEPKEWYVVCVERDTGSNRLMTDYFGEGFTEEEAKTKADAENEHYNYHAWVAVHIPA